MLDWKEHLRLAQMTKARGISFNCSRTSRSLCQARN